MAQIDPLLRALAQRHSEALLFVSGERVSLKHGKETRPLTGQSLSDSQIRKILSEFVPAGEMAKIDGSQARFRYVLQDVGAFAGRAQMSGGILIVTIVPDKGDKSRDALEEAPAAPAEASAPSPVPPPAAPAASPGRPEPAAPRASGSPTLAAHGGRGAGASRPATTSLHAMPSLAVDTGPAQDRHLIDKLFREMVALGASDLHICVGVAPMVRLDGRMLALAERQPHKTQDTERLLLPLLPERNKRQFDEINDTDFAYELPGVARFRCNLFRDRHGIAGVFRQIPARIMTVEELGLSKPIQNLCFLSKGLVLVTGPTGSGKTTTLATLIDLVNTKREDHIITIEDPIEFVHLNKSCLVNQREVGVHTSSFKHALRAALREDPDVVLVGEMRDLETVSIAIETAVTGHLVFGTLHTSTAVQTVDRIIDQFPADRQEQVRVMLSDSLKGVISQTLLRKRGGGRIAALEILLGTQSSSNLIREGKTYQLPSVMQTSRNLGMTTLNDVLVDYVKRGLVEPEEAYIKAVDKEALVSMFKKADITLKL